MARTEKCRGCMNENKCDFITCRIEENKESKGVIMESVNVDTLYGIIDYLLDWLEDEHLGLRERAIEEIEEKFGLKL